MSFQYLIRITHHKTEAYPSLVSFKSVCGRLYTDFDELDTELRENTSALFRGGNHLFPHQHQRDLPLNSRQSAFHLHSASICRKKLWRGISWIPFFDEWDSIAQKSP